LLELVGVFCGEAFGAGQVFRHADGFEIDAGIAFAYAVFDHPDGDMGDVDPDPAPPEFLRRIDRSAAAAKRIEDQVARVR
jgi:hypothetical protein